MCALIAEYRTLGRLSRIGLAGAYRAVFKLGTTVGYITFSVCPTG